MAFSYLNTVKKIVPEPIYQRGVKAYIEGCVVGFEEMLLDYWREYKVLGTDECIVKIPLLHLALNKEKFDRADKALDESTSCTCPYFNEYGICKHVVAVCAGLDSEFNVDLQKSKNKLLKKDSESILTKIFEAEQTRNIREFENNLEFYLENSRPTDFHWLESFTTAVKDNPEVYKSFLHSLHGVIERCLRDYDKEKKVAAMIPRSLLVGHQVWWKFWQKHLDNLTSEKKVEVWVQIWEQRSLDFVYEFGEEIDAKVKLFEDNFKSQILSELQKKFHFNKQIWLNFALTSRYKTWFDQNITNLDPQTLIEVALIWPDDQEEIEEIILKQVRIWTDFLQAGEYDELIQVMNNWLIKLGGSEFYQEALLYIKQVHKNKPSLIRKLKK